MQITLSEDGIRATIACPKLGKGLAKYVAIQARVAEPAPVAPDTQFRTRFNGFYRIRRGQEWQTQFYELLDHARQVPVSFGYILSTLHERTGRWEASFASKLHATVNPDAPVVDANVLHSLGVRLPWPTCSDRLVRIERLYVGLTQCYREYLVTAAGRFLVTEFSRVHPNYRISEMKMLDLVLWQS